MTIPKNKIEWKLVGYLRQGETKNYDYLLTINEPLASWDVYDYWEKERVRSMQEHLKKGDVLFDVGVELGWMSLALAQIVGPENMVLVEPSPEFWPNIKALWGKNFNISPLGCYPGFFSDKSTQNAQEFISATSFPHPQSDGDLTTTSDYRNLSRGGESVPAITIDEYVEKTGHIPNGLTIDVEGAELLVLRGAEKTLKENHIKVWVSEHDDLSFDNYGVTKEALKEFMYGLGYVRQVLATDHERHVFYWK